MSNVKPHSTTVSYVPKPFQERQMNSLQNDEPNIADVAAELRRYDAACAELLSLLRRQQRTRQEDELCIVGYTELKAQLKRDAVHGTIGGAKRSMSDAERFFFDYAVRHAAQALKAATNHARVVSTWAQAVSNAQGEIKYKLHDLEKCNPGA